MTRRRKVGPSSPDRKAIKALAEDERAVSFREQALQDMVDLRVPQKTVRSLICDATEGACQLWKTTTSHSASCMGQTIYQLCPRFDGLDLFVEFKIRGNYTLKVISVHEDDLKGKNR